MSFLTDSLGRGVIEIKGSQSITPSYVFWNILAQIALKAMEIYTQTYHTISDCFNNINIIFRKLQNTGENKENTSSIHLQKLL